MMLALWNGFARSWLFKPAWALLACVHTVNFACNSWYAWVSFHATRHTPRPSALLGFHPSRAFVGGYCLTCAVVGALCLSVCYLFLRYHQPPPREEPQPTPA